MSDQNPRLSQEGVPLSYTTTSTTSSSSPPPKKHKLSLSASGKFFPSRSVSRSRARSDSPTPTDLPLDVPRSRTRHRAETLDIPRSHPSTEYSARRSTSPRPMSPAQSQDPSVTAQKRVSGSYTYSPRRSGDDYRRYSGTVNHYGRHSNDWLFGGFSLRDTVRDGVEKLREFGDKS
ncbi:hypothetical protein P170DRAFT_433358 [Aspergillus steynii IBT 23096]|uniref:Uncharacterized protein n=1 Tax=Aspergillus steynii IBT 23096 TaxID=1392250 RepID=A0A2I2GSP4_9EURO|nr:uncharacterized protein P170DRAFT_433358 [Aspergillus steynii IBT 23096]PLB55885.1 hypothetical protein P170DRAFT_433358 [Aspergillus steynii IBT 23096]